MAEASELYKTKFNEAYRLWEADDPDRAISILNQIIELEPAVGTARALKASILLDMGKLQEAIDAFLDHQRYRPRVPATSMGLYSALLQSGRLREAVQEGERFRALYENTVDKAEFHKDKPEKEEQILDYLGDVAQLKRALEEKAIGGC